MAIGSGLFAFIMAGCSSSPVALTPQPSSASVSTAPGIVTSSPTVGPTPTVSPSSAATITPSFRDMQGSVVLCNRPGSPAAGVSGDNRRLHASELGVASFTP